MADSPTIGKAYVQILPTMKGTTSNILGDLKPSVDSASETSGESGGNLLGSKLGTAFKKVITVAAIGEAIKKSIEEGAQIEQSLGGVKTLFGDSYKDIVSAAQSGYKTAGVSMNTYMEQVTSFAASLKQSLNGNTKETAAYANRAMTDMSDNANKMGTSIESIQSAYQGFAKQNYTMLDNLKLGYGGTKTEMQRLIADAANMTDIQKELNVTVDEGDLSFGNIVNAISVMQKSLGITGTTASEAEHTLSGSFNAMKAAATDFIGVFTVVGEQEADEAGITLKNSLKNLVDSVSTFAFGNLLPAVGRILVNVLNMITESLKELANIDWNTIFDGGIGGLSDFFMNSLLPAILSLISAIATYLPPAIISLVQALASTVTENLSSFVVSLGEFINSGMLFNITQQVGSWITGTLVPTVISLLGTLLEKLPSVLGSLLTLVIQFAALNLQATVGLLGSLLGSIGEFFLNILTSIGEWLNGLTDSFVSWGAERISAIASWGSNIWSTITGIWDNVKNTFSEKINSIKTIVTDKFNAIKEKILSPIQSARDKVKSIINAIKGFFNFNISWPHVPLPHFSIRPSGWKIGDLLRGSIPSLGISWYAKAMDEPYMLSGAHLIGAGEAGDEVIYGHSQLMSDIQRAVQASGNTNTTNNYDVTINVTKSNGESDEEFAKRLRKEIQKLDKREKLALSY